MAVRRWKSMPYAAVIDTPSAALPDGRQSLFRRDDEGDKIYASDQRFICQYFIFMAILEMPLLRRRSSPMSPWKV